MDELPCPHAWAVLKNQQLKPGQYCSFYYKKDNLLRTYEFLVNPLPDESLWIIPTEVLEDVVLPPKGRRNAGRPRKERLKPASEKECSNSFRNNKKKPVVEAICKPSFAKVERLYRG
ncbi:PREDICTED: uncharacterized protein LOC109207303 [Nicotiana attenuata]|uniref:uncharacterized protein LOC109207303 n=1 Tax=Nicotiana attenuata TaxID=49451 RepID=UPI0009057256|nr:PREDICTED: uncharacterized protein LOC109207303 [Nicotiana attenuata]